MTKKEQAIKEACWNNRGPNDFYRMHDAVIDVFDEEDLHQKVCEKLEKDEYLRAILNILPIHILGIGISWGMSDTVFGDEIYTFAEENKQEILKALDLNGEVQASNP